MKKSFKIDGMSCKHCVASVEKGVGEMPGVEKVKVSLRKGKAEIKFDDQLLSAQQILDKITELGYEGEELA